MFASLPDIGGALKFVFEFPLSLTPSFPQVSSLFLQYLLLHLHLVDPIREGSHMHCSFTLENSKAMASPVARSECTWSRRATIDWLVSERPKKLLDFLRCLLKSPTEEKYFPFRKAPSTTWRIE